MRSLVLLALAGCAPFPTTDPGFAVGSHAAFVDPFIGTGGEGYTFPGAVAPWGMVAPSPHNALTSALDYVEGNPVAPSGYRDGGGRLLGFGLTHLSGVGCPELGAPTVQATTGTLLVTSDGYGSVAANERAWPGYYGADLGDFGVRAEATATVRAGLFRFRFPARNGDANILVDAGTVLSWAGGDGDVQVVSPSEIAGWSQTGQFCASGNLQRAFFVARASRDADTTGTWVDGVAGAAPEASGNAGAFFRFSTAGAEAIELAVGISYVSIDNARANLDAEIGALGFDDVRAATLAAWEAALGRIDVSGGSNDDRTIFYSALYHALIHPSVLSDVNGEYPRFRGGGTVATADGYVRHHVFSLWDTYRTVHPLLTLVYPERQHDLLLSLAAMMAEAGVPPRWELAGNETDIMVGEPAAIVLGDSWVKGLRDFDVAGSYAVLRAAAVDTSPTAHRPGNASYLALGYVPIEDGDSVWGPVSTTLEYNLADFNLARLAEGLGFAADAAQFDAQAHSWRALFDTTTTLLRPRHSDGSWLVPFDPDALEGSRNTNNHRSGGPGYVEGTAWNYQFAVPHDVAAHAALFGGTDAYRAALQAQFDDDKFVMWNEPDLNFPWQFSAADGGAAQTQRMVATVRRAAFTSTRDGIPGNDDAGTMSAWYVFAAIGLSPLCPGTDRYALGSPVFDHVDLALSGGHLVIDAPHPTPDSVIVTTATLDGADVTTTPLTHARLLAGGTLTLTLTK